MSRQRVSTINNLDNAHLAAAADAVVNPANGQIVCNVTLTNPGLYPGCVPLNLFGQNTINSAMSNYILSTTTYHLRENQDDVAGSLSGSLFDTWAGPVNMALSGEYRHLTLDVTSNASPLDHVNCTGLRYNCIASGPTATPLYLSNVVANATGRVQNVTEGAFEVNVPLLKDVFLARSLNLNGAVRYTHYDTSGNATTWKVGLDWHLTDELTVRATRSRDIRAPNLNDLFAPISINPAGYTDLHTGNLSGTANVQSQGNPNLKPEVANTLTAGFVYKPGWFPRFSIAIDYYNIKIGDAIGTVSGQTAAVQKQCEASGGTDPLCALFIRPLPFSDHSAANFPTTVLSQPLNIATLKTAGIDFEMNYSAPLLGGNLSLRGLATYVNKLTTVTIPGAEPTYQAGSASTNTAGLPKVKVTAFVHYDIGAFSADVQERWFSSTRPSSTHSFIYTDPRFPAAAYTDLTLAYLLKVGSSQAQVFFSVQNLLNRKIDPYAGAGGGSSVPGLFITTANGEDPIGRYFTGGVRFRF
jgi:outer membrane receptor protein involved in Fe transport